MGSEGRIVTKANAWYGLLERAKSPRTRSSLSADPMRPPSRSLTLWLGADLHLLCFPALPGLLPPSVVLLPIPLSAVRWPLHFSFVQ
eukprot:360154-Chlamydomonas_euryale.AAC.8